MKPDFTEVALIISTYNWPEALAAVLESVTHQTLPPAEVIVTDDGSAPPTAEAVEKALRTSPLRWAHVWQEDRGFRQARARNLGVKAARAPYLIFIDHDVILHPHFIEDHVRLARRGSFLQGKRVFLPQALSQQILAGSGQPRRTLSPWLRGLGNRKNAWFWPGLGRLLAWPRRFQTALRGCNLSVPREQFLAVDGFDESFDGLWGREDSDFCYRLFHTGSTCRNLWFMAIQYHLFHPTQKRRTRDRLDEELDVVRSTRRTRAKRGFSQMDAEGWWVSGSAGSPSPLPVRPPGRR